MTLTELKNLLYEYEAALWSPSRQGVRLGCDCGCGGDSYTIESWDAEEEQAQLSIDNLKEFCAKHAIEYDGID